MDVRKNIVVDWQTQVVDEWFNSSDGGGFIKFVTDKGLYGNLEELGIVTVHPDPSFNRNPAMKRIRAWFKRRLKNIRSSRAPGDSRMFVVRGCTSQQTPGMTEMLKVYAKKTLPDEDVLIQLVKRFTSRFVCTSPDVLVPEKFFSDLTDEVFTYCASSLDSITFISSEYLNSDEISKTVSGFFPDGSTELMGFGGPEIPEGRPMTVRLVDSVRYFGELFRNEGIEPPEPDSSEAQLVEFATDEVLAKVKSAL